LSLIKFDQNKKTFEIKAYQIFSIVLGNGNRVFIDLEKENKEDENIN
jgi:hypothetical protein